MIPIIKIEIEPNHDIRVSLRFFLLKLIYGINVNKNIEIDNINLIRY